MTIPATEPTKIFVNGNGVATVFSFSPMNIFQASDLQVTRVDAAGTETLLVEGSGGNQYTINITDFPGTPVTGSITFPSTGSPLPLLEQLVMIAVLPLEQQTDLENQGGYFPDVQETQFDKHTKLIIQLQEQLDRTVLLALSVQGVSTELPIPVADRLLGWNSTATALINKASAGLLSTTSFSESFLDDTNAEEGRDTIMFGAAKGDVLVGDGSTGSALLAVGADGQVLTADSASALGLKWTEFIASGTKMLFQQTAAPVGWTKDVVHNDKALRVVTGAASSGGATAFSGVFPQATTGSHVLTTAEIAPHAHASAGSHLHVQGADNLGGGSTTTINAAVSFASVAPNAAGNTQSAGGHTHASAGGGAGHTHTMIMDLQFVDLIIATKD